MSDLWTTASQDTADASHRKLTATLRIEAVEYWPFLAEADDAADFGNRMALISPELDRIVRNRTDNAGTFTSARAELEASFERDFEVLASERYNTDSRGVRYVGKGRSAPKSFKDPATCGSCGRTWDDGHVTGVTPAPSARCPFEYMTGHKGAKTAAEGDTSYGRAPECHWCGEKVTQDKGRKGWNGWRDKSGSGTCAGGKDPHEPWLDDSSPSRLDSIESSKTAVWEDECYGCGHRGTDWKGSGYSIQCPKCGSYEVHGTDKSRKEAATATLVPGKDLNNKQRNNVLNAFPYRWTHENRSRTQAWGKCPKCDINKPYENSKSSNGHTHPTVPLQHDDQWLKEHAFHMNKRDELSGNHRGAEPHYASESLPDSDLEELAAHGNELAAAMLEIRKRRNHTSSTYAQEQAERLRAERSAPFKATHTYSPIGWDQFDPKGVKGSPISSGAKVELLKEHTKGLQQGMPADAKQMFNVVRDADGNFQHVNKKSLHKGGAKTAETFGDQYYDPNGKPCSQCGRGMDSLSEFPGDRCISCHANSPEGRAMPTADELSRMWGGPGVVGAKKVYCPCGKCGKPCEVVGKLASLYECDECRGL